MGAKASTRTSLAYIGIGSNMGKSLQNCYKAIDFIDQTDDCSVAKISAFYRTEPQGAACRDWYVNGVIEIETSLDPHELLNALLSIEAGMGRVRRQKWEARIIDLDIIFYDDAIIRQPDLQVPHPLMHERRFVLVPMARLNPGWIHPVLGKSMAELLTDLDARGQAVLPLGDL
ncbi:MAG: 2-amino-4-hydroxy-6-hydroxymethyldihydropteridine diphosphokinase [Deltaproteobacteria bacterium]|nr:2-amino-4-hydroxy-6-hydroxymethyldihydropteridine diphosphokinase [Deltaproteobacteria bacterium]